MKLIYYITLVVCLFGAINADDKKGVFDRTNCIADGGEICGQWDSLCCSGVSVQAEDAYDCWFLFPIIKKKIRVCGSELKKDKDKESETKEAAATTAAPVATAAAPAQQAPQVTNEVQAPATTTSIPVVTAIPNTGVAQ